MPLLIGPSHEAEVGIEQVMTFQSEELGGDLSFPAAGDPGDGNLGVVVADLAGDSPEEGEGAAFPSRSEASSAEAFGKRMLFSLWI